MKNAGGDSKTCVVFEKVLVGKPLLSEPDKKTVHAVMEDVDAEEGECLNLNGTWNRSPCKQCLSGVGIYTSGIGI